MYWRGSPLRRNVYPRRPLTAPECLVTRLPMKSRTNNDLLSSTLYPQTYSVHDRIILFFATRPRDLLICPWPNRRPLLLSRVSSSRSETLNYSQRIRSDPRSRNLCPEESYMSLWVPLTLIIGVKHVSLWLRVSFITLVRQTETSSNETRLHCIPEQHQPEYFPGRRNT